MIYCTGCNKEVNARLTDGKEIYPHRPDLHSLPFWKCDTCKNFVGCHHKTKTPTKPLGCIPNPIIKKYRMMIHAVIDPLWKGGYISRNLLYKLLNDELGKEYHTADIRSEEEAIRTYQVACKLAKQIKT